MAQFHHIFVDFDLATMPDVPRGWFDISYRNDSCPSYRVGDFEGLHCIIFVDYADADKRECPGFGRYVLNCIDPSTSNDWEDQHESDDFDFIVSKVAAFMARVAP